MDGNFFGSGNSTTNMSTASWPRGAEIASEPHWFLSLAISLLVFLANIWIAFAFIYHAIKTKVLKKKRSRRDVNGGLVMILAMVSVVAPLIRYIGTLYLLFVSLNPDDARGCETANDVCVAGFGIALVPVYSFLWARQRAFYGHPSLGHMFGKCVSVFSSISLVLIVLSAITLLAVGIYPDEYEPRPGGCYLIGGVEQDEFRTYIYAAVMISSQLVLLGLFLHPIRLHAQNQKSFDTNHGQRYETTEISSTEPLSSSGDGITTKGPNDESYKNSTLTTQVGSPKSRSLSVPANHNLKKMSSDLDPLRRASVDPVGERKSSLNPPVVRHANKTSPMGVRATTAVTNFKKRVRRTTMRSRKVYGLIKRVLYLAIISVLTDIICMIINAFIIPDDIPQTYSFVMYDVSVLINVITVVLSFETWRTMMLSPFGIKEKKNKK